MTFALKKFLFFWDLKVFGKVMAYFGMVTSILSAVLSIGISIMFLYQDDIEHNKKNVHFAAIITALIIMEMAFLGLIAAYFFYSFELYDGVRQEIASKMKGSLYAYGIITVLFTLSMLYHLAFIAGVIVFAYIWFCLYSLYANTRQQ